MSEADVTIALKIGELLSEAEVLLDERGVPQGHPRLKEIAATVNALYEGMSPEAKQQNEAAKFIERIRLHTTGGAL